MATRMQRLRDWRTTALVPPHRPMPALITADPRPTGARDDTVAIAQRIYDTRRSRDERFGAELFSDPAWDILLYLYVAASRSRSICVSDACYGAAAPETTALRKLKQLEDLGLVIREGDPDDARRSNLSLSTSARRNMRRLLKEACPAFGLPD